MSHLGLGQRDLPKQLGLSTKCARCGELIEPDEPWDLDHDNSRLFYLGASHARCNRGAANELRTSREW